jgi:hypothetical protein
MRAPRAAGAVTLGGSEARNTVGQRSDVLCAAQSEAAARLKRCRGSELQKR